MVPDEGDERLREGNTRSLRCVFRSCIEIGHANLRLLGGAFDVPALHSGLFVAGFTRLLRGPPPGTVGATPNSRVTVSGHISP